MQSFYLTVAGSLVCFFGVLLADFGPGPFVTCICVGFALLLANTSALAIATMACVPSETRPLAVGLNTLLLHALGS
jgi:hypothetical protein